MDFFFPPHRCLLLHFKDSHLTPAIMDLGESMEAMGWDVFRKGLDNTDSKKAQEELQQAVEILIQGIENKDQGIIVFYGGYGLQTPRGEMVKPPPGHAVTWKDWKWHADPTDGPLCLDHTVTIDPEPLLKQLDTRLSNNTIIILNSPCEIRETYFTTWTRNRKPNRNVQLLLLRENWSMPINTYPLGSCATNEEGKPKTCWNEVLQIPKGFVDEPVRKMSESLRKLVRYLDEDEGWNFLQAYKRIQGIGRREPEIWPILGMPQKHFLTKGCDPELLMELEEG